MKTIDLCGKWSLSYDTGYRKQQGYQATVPGIVQHSFRELYPDPHTKHVCLEGRWLEETAFVYRKSFALDAEDLEKKRVRLVFEGLDLTAEVFVNGHLAGKHNNFYTPARFDVTALVRDGENTVEVHIESGLIGAGNKSVKGLYPQPWDAGVNIHKRMWLRKPQCSFEWDWSPRYINAGIYKPCRVEISDGVFLDETSVYCDTDASLKSAAVRIKQYLSLADKGCDIKARAVVRETGECARFEGHIDPSKPFAELIINIDRPRLWYPRGYGKQELYTVDISVTGESGETMSLSKTTGIRRAQIDRSPHPDEGEYFILTVNGRRVFAKGANFVPADIDFSAIKRSDYETLVSRAEEAGFNMLRVWGGGLYESDDFYELCDRAGILVWQDLIGACAGYPAYDTEFTENYKSEILYQIRRMSRFPSLVIYSGNNELDWQNRDISPRGDLMRFPDAQLYHVIVPEMLHDEGENRYYQPSSPYSPDHSYPNCFTVGDQHPWGIGFYDKDYFHYRDLVCRFPNEGGILGPTSRPNMLMCFGGDEPKLDSFDFEFHNNSIEQQFPQEKMLSEKLSKSRADMTLEQYIYYGGFLQGEGLTEYILNFRRRKYDCASAIFWMFNDCWPASNSWTIVDYMRNRTPSFYPVKRAFSPVFADISRDTGGKLTVTGINDRLIDETLTLEYGSFTPDGRYNTHRKTVTLPADSALPVAVIDPLENGFIPYAELYTDPLCPVSRRRFVDKAYSTLGLCDEAVIKTEKHGSLVSYSCDSAVFGVCIDIDGKHLGDNFFDLYPGKPYTVDTFGSCDGEVLFYLR